VKLVLPGKSPPNARDHPSNSKITKSPLEFFLDHVPSSNTPEVVDSLIEASEK